MDKFLDTLFDPKVIIAGLVGWTLRGVLEQYGRHADQTPSAQAMAGAVFRRQTDVAKAHAVKRAQELVDDRTRMVVDGLFPRARTKSEQRVIQLTVPK